MMTTSVPQVLSFGNHVKRGILATLLAVGALFSASAASAAPREIVITGNDSMKFNVTKIEVAAGEEITITFQNVGTMPKQAMGHNLILLKKDVNAQAYASAALKAAATEYVPAALADQVIGHTKLLGPKQKDSFTFKAPTEAGDYTYLCSFPAHFVAGMKGVMTVK
ncbi:MAG TPA: plastocyanin/azurin family copper-binding protein [Opitutaceae bacterium]